MPTPLSRSPFRCPLACALALLAWLVPSSGATGMAVATELSATVPTWVEYPDKPFDIMATEVTVAEFEACAAAGRCAKTDVDQACNAGDPLKADHPINCITHDGAANVCVYLGGRLCTSVEWLTACAGTQRRSFPYGEEFRPEACNAGSYQHPSAAGRSTVAVASMRECEGGLAGLYDMGGNVSEWMADCKGDYCKFRGGAYANNDPIDYFAGCADRCSGNDHGLKSGSVGARCCRDRP